MHVYIVQYSTYLDIPMYYHIYLYVHMPWSVEDDTAAFEGRNKLLERIAEVCFYQGNCHLAARTFTQAGNRIMVCVCVCVCVCVFVHAMWCVRMYVCIVGCLLYDISYIHLLAHDMCILYSLYVHMCVCVYCNHDPLSLRV